MSAWEAAGQSDEWYTPPAVFEALGCVFDQDVSPARHGKSHVPAKTMLVGDGLVEPWHKFIWGNFPFGGRNGLQPWLNKFFAHGNGIALVPDRTSAPWFWDAFRQADAVLFTRKLRFLKPDGTEGKSPSCGTALIAIGPQGGTALDNAYRAGFGILAFPGERLIEAHARTSAIAA
jgi:hypothetical protein